MSGTAAPVIDPLFITSIRPYVDVTGFHRPTFGQVLTWLKTQFLGIYGQDIYLGADTQDAQWLAVMALAIDDANNGSQAAYNSFSPATAIGAGLSSNVKINGLKRQVSTFSSCDVVVNGAVGTVLSNASVRDDNNVIWLLPPDVVLTGGQDTVTTTCSITGAVTAIAGSLHIMNTPQLGWYSVVNLSAAAPGQPVETDAVLRRRQASSTMIAATSLLDTIVGDIELIPGVTRVVPYENDTGQVNNLGIPANQIAIVVDGGDAEAIGVAIANKKSLGGGTYGTTTVSVVDQQGQARLISFYRPAQAFIQVNLELQALTGYTDSIGTAVVGQVAAYISSLPFGSILYLSRLYAAANLPDDRNLTFNVTSLTFARAGSANDVANIALVFYEAATCTAANITLTART